MARCPDPLVGSGRYCARSIGARSINGRVKLLPLAWAGMPKTSYRKSSDSPLSFKNGLSSIRLTNMFHTRTIIDSIEETFNVGFDHDMILS